LYASTLLESNQSLLEPRDTYGNVRIPRLEHLSGYADDQGWIDVSDISSPVQYASLVGVPVKADLRAGNANYSIEASYLNLTCNTAQNFSYWHTQQWKENTGLVWQPRVTANITPLGDEEESKFTSFFLDTFLRFNDDARLGEEYDVPYNASWASDPLLDATRSILWGSYVPNGMMTTNCSVNYVHVEAFVDCPTSNACAVSRIRPSQKDTRSIRLTPFDVDTTASMFFALLPYATGQSTPSGESSPTSGS